MCVCVPVCFGVIVCWSSWYPRQVTCFTSVTRAFRWTMPRNADDGAIGLGRTLMNEYVLIRFHIMRSNYSVLANVITSELANPHTGCRGRGEHDLWCVNPRLCMVCKEETNPVGDQIRKEDNFSLVFAFWMNPSAWFGKPNYMVKKCPVHSGSDISQ